MNALNDINAVESSRPEAVRALLLPITEGKPAGEDLLFSNDFDVIQEARRFEDPSLDQGEWVTEIKEADWDLVISRATGLLSTQTKDLRLAVWLTEAWGLKDGLAGLTQGYALLDGLCTDYWDSFHPLPEEGDQDYRLGNVGWLSGRTAELLRGIALTNGGAGRYGALDWEVATHLVQAVKRDPNNADDILRGKVTIDAFDAARRATKPSFYTQVLRDLAAFEHAYRSLEATLDARAGDDAPSFRQVKDAYETVRRLAERFAKEAGIDPAGALEGAPGGGGQASTDTATAGQASAGGTYDRIEPQFEQTETDGMGQLSVVSNGASNAAPTHTLSGGASGPVTSRAQAIVRLREIAAFFRRTEPHSPAAYMAEKAAVWADMPLHEWLNAVVKDGASLEQLNDMLGVKKIDE